MAADDTPKRVKPPPGQIKVDRAAVAGLLSAFKYPAIGPKTPPAVNNWPTDEEDDDGDWHQT